MKKTVFELTKQTYGSTNMKSGTTRHRHSPTTADFLVGFKEDFWGGVYAGPTIVYFMCMYLHVYV